MNGKINFNMKTANYRKHTDHSHNSSTYHKKDGTPIRAILKEEMKEQIKELDTKMKQYTFIYSEEIGQYGSRKYVSKYMHVITDDLKKAIEHEDNVNGRDILFVFDGLCEQTKD